MNRGEFHYCESVLWALLEFLFLNAGSNQRPKNIQPMPERQIILAEKITPDFWNF